MILHVMPQQLDSPEMAVFEPKDSLIKPAFDSPLGTAIPSLKRAASTSISQTSPSTRLNKTIRFYTMDEVDQPAYPKLDWELPLDKLVAVGLRRLVIQIKILDSGEIFDLDIMSITPSSLGDQDKRNIMKWLMQTPITPAIKGAKHVASQRTIEFAFDM